MEMKDTLNQYQEFYSFYSQPLMQTLTVVIYVFVDIIFCREDLAHRSEKRLWNKCTGNLVLQGRHQTSDYCPGLLVLSNDICVHGLNQPLLLFKAELMEIKSKEQAGCERNKGGHGRVMNYLDVEQPDLYTWVTTCMQVPQLWVMWHYKSTLAVISSPYGSSLPHQRHSQFMNRAESVNTICFVCNNPREECPTVEDGERVVHRACGTNELRRGEKRRPSMGLLFRYWMGIFERLCLG